MTAYLEGWLGRVEEHRANFRDRLFSPAEFGDRLAKLTKAAGSPFTAITVELNPGADRDITVLGSTGSGDETHRTTLQLGETTTAIIRAWSGGEQVSTHDTGTTAIGSLVESWWRVSDRDGMTGLLQSSRTGVLEALAASVSAWSMDNLCPIAFGDVDRFKQLNDALGQVEGDRAIALVAGFVADLSPRDGIVLRRGGDEFLLALPPRPARQLVDELTSLRSEVERRLQDTYTDLGGEPLGFSMGVALISSGDVAAAGWDERSERTMKPGGVKQRGRVSFEVDPDFVGVAVDAARTSVESTRARLGEQDPFSNVWLRWLSALVESTPAVQLTAELVSDAIATIDPVWMDASEGRSVGVDGGSLDGSRELSALDIALAVAHGATRGRAGGSGDEAVVLSFTSDGRYARVAVGDQALFDHGSPAGELIEAPFPRMLGEPSKIDARRLIAITIGESADLHHGYLYADRIYLDDRPTRGGGLPDFWEAALAQVVDSLQKHPNVLAVVIEGNPSHGVQTMRWMQANWSDEELTYLSTKLNLAPQELATIRDRLIGAVTLLHDGSPTELEIATSIQGGGKALEETPLATSPTVHPRLHRQLVARQFLLGQQDGCRVQTASVAYPIALDIVRQTNAAFYDSQNRPFSELIDFRIHLTEPIEDPIPRYYLGDKDPLEAYFDREFMSAGGKFFDALALNDQFEHVLTHLCSCIGTQAFATRRAVLVLPHSPTSSDISPLGLVSVRAIPRLEEDGRVRLDFSFTWRTVEAIVGLPYSLFGSIRFAEEITNAVIARVEISNSPSVSMGELSYIAHSLHMYNDGYGANVARRIVNDESF